MKLLEDMTIDEICELTEEQLDRRVKLECAEQGIGLAPEPPEMESFDLVKSVNGHIITGIDMVFSDLTAAECVLEALLINHKYLRTKKYDWRTGYDIEWLEPHDRELTIDTKSFYDPNVVRDRESFLVKRKNTKELHEKHKKDYESSREKYRKIADNVYSEFYHARDTKQRILSARRMFDEYLGLADGDRVKARVFFDKALKQNMAEEVYAAVFPSNEEAVIA
jgi:hypothetical protein